jgi:hypothetical protein
VDFEVGICCKMCLKLEFVVKSLVGSVIFGKKKFLSQKNLKCEKYCGIEFKQFTDEKFVK